MTDIRHIPAEPARRAALRAALAPRHAPPAGLPDLDNVKEASESTPDVVTDLCVQLTRQQVDAVVAIANALHYVGALSELLPERDQQKAFRGAAKALKMARIAAARPATHAEEPLRNARNP
jgi:hypothetical protein